MPGMIHTPMVDEMIAGGQGEELDKMLKTLVPMARMGRRKRLQMPSCGFAAMPPAMLPASRSQ